MIPCRDQPNPTDRTSAICLYASGLKDVTPDRAEVTGSGAGPLTLPLALQRNPSATPRRSVAVGTHLVGDPALLQTVLRQPRIGDPDRALDMIRGAGEIVR